MQKIVMVQDQQNKLDINNIPIPELNCDTCGQAVIPIEGVTAIFRNNIWWHTKCCDFDFEDGKPIVAFLSKGKLIPNTILHTVD